MVQLPLAAVSLIAENIKDPFPEHYLRLARVSKQFNLIFSSDKLWEKFNVYNIPEDIRKHYLKLKTSMSKWEWYFDYPDVDNEIDDFSEEYNQLNRYSQLSVLRMRNREMDWLAGQVSCWQLMKCAVMLDGLAIQYAEPELRNDPELVRLAVKQNGMALPEVSPEFAKDRSIVLDAARSNGQFFTCMYHEFRADREIVEAAIRSCPNCINGFSEELQKDPKILKLAFTSSYRCEPLHFVPLERVTKELAIDAVSHYAPQMEQLAGKYGDDKDVILAAVQAEGWTIHFASERLKADRQVVATAVEHSGAALGVAPESLKNDREFVYKCVKLNGAAYGYASEALQGERELALLAASHGMAIKSMPEKFQNDREIASRSIKSDPMSLRFVSKALRDSTELVQLAIDAKPAALRWASDRIKADPAVALAALARDGSLLEVLPQFQKCKALQVYAMNSGANARMIAKKREDGDLKALARWTAGPMSDLSGYEWWGMSSQERLASIFLKDFYKY